MQTCLTNGITYWSEHYTWKWIGEPFLQRNRKQVIGNFSSRFLHHSIAQFNVMWNSVEDLMNYIGPYVNNLCHEKNDTMFYLFCDLPFPERWVRIQFHRLGTILTRNNLNSSELCAEKRQEHENIRYEETAIDITSIKNANIRRWRQSAINPFQNKF